MESKAERDVRYAKEQERGDYMFGWIAGARVGPLERADLPAYLRGYKAGRAAFRAENAAERERLGLPPEADVGLNEGE